MTVLEFAKKRSYDMVTLLTNKWKGYTVYAPGFSDNVIRNIGLPFYILVDDNGKMRWTTPDECLDCLNFMIKKKEFGNND